MYSQDSSFIIPPSSKKSFENKKKWYKHWWGKLIIIFVTIFVVILLALGFYIGKVIVLLKKGQISPQQLFGNSIQLDRSDLATEDDPSRGPRDAKVVVVEFADFGCPACQEVQPVVKQVLADYGDKILFIWRDFPMTGDTQTSLLAAVAGECANKQGGFWAMQEKIFANPADITELSLKTYAIQIGINSVQFGSCLQADENIKEIEEDVREGYAAGVESTPTFFINGVKVPGAIPLNIFEQIIASQLNQ